MQQLLSRLQAEGISIGMPQILRIQQVLHTLGADYVQQPDKLADILVPLIAQNAAEQQKAKRIINEYVQQLQNDALRDYDTIGEINAASTPPYQKYLVGLLVFGLLGLLAMMIWLYGKTDTNCTLTKPTFGFLTDTSKIIVGDTTQIQRTNASAQNTYFKWQINDSSFVATDTLVYYPFTKAGTYNISLSSICQKDTAQQLTYSAQIHVWRNPKDAPPIIEPNRIPLRDVRAVTMPTEKITNWSRIVWLNLGLLLLCCIPIVYGLWWYNVRQLAINAQYRKLLEQYKKRLTLLATANEPLEPPYELVFPTQTQHIEISRDMYDGANALRQRQIHDRKQIDVRQTIEQTIRAAGMPTFVERHQSRPSEYLVLIDSASTDDYQARFFEYWIDTLIKEEVLVDKFLFRHDPRWCWNKTEFMNGISIERLQQLYPEHRLLIVSNGEYFIHTIETRLNHWVLPSFEAWQQRIFVTPEPVNSWHYREQLLSKVFPIVPATAEGQAAIVELLTGDAPPTFRTLKQRFAVSSQGIAISQTDLSDDLHQKLPPELFDLLCCTALYPEPNWNLTLALAKALVDAQQLPADVLSNQSLLQLAQVKWLQTGSLQPKVRQELLSYLSFKPPLEKAARLALAILVKDAMQNLPNNAYAKQIGTDLLKEQKEALDKIQTRQRSRRMTKGGNNYEQSYQQEEVAPSIELENDDIFADLDKSSAPKTTDAPPPPDRKNIQIDKVLAHNEHFKTAWQQLSWGTFAGLAVFVAIILAAVQWVFMLTNLSPAFVTQTMSEQAKQNNAIAIALNSGQIDTSYKWKVQSEKITNTLDSTNYNQTNCYNLGVANYKWAMRAYKQGDLTQAVRKLEEINGCFLKINKNANTDSLLCQADILHALGVCYFYAPPDSYDTSPYATATKLNDSIKNLDTTYYNRLSKMYNLNNLIEVYEGYLAGAIDTLPAWVSRSQQQGVSLKPIPSSINQSDNNSSVDVQQTETHAQKLKRLANDIRQSGLFEYVAPAFKDDRLLVRNGGKAFFVDDNNKPITPYYDTAEEFYNGRAKVTLNGRSFDIDKNGREIAGTSKDMKSVK
ncbi:MAG: hypothetical protein KA783_10310 [Chitinophagales bacterium]|nr:hypothetical protein [Chitinophagales bacterium]